MSGKVTDNLGRASGLVKGVAAASSDFVKITSATVAAGSGVVAINSFDGDTYSSYLFNMWEVKPNLNDNSLIMQLNFDSTADTGTDYYDYVPMTGGATLNPSATANWALSVTDNQQTTTFYPWYTVRLINMHEATNKHAWFSGGWHDDNYYYGNNIFKSLNNNGTDCNGFTITPTAGTIQYKYALYGIK